MPLSPQDRSGDARKLPRGRHGLPRAVVVENQRTRIFEALAAVVRRKGYVDVTVQDIIDSAGVSRRTFYDFFGDKEQCFLAAYDEVVELLFTNVERAYATSAGSWPQRVRFALRELLATCAGHPALARLAVVDVLAAGPTALARRDDTLRRFTVFFAAGRTLLPETMALTDLLAQAVVGGLYDALYGSILRGETERLPDLTADLVYCTLVPYLGHDRAMAEAAAGTVEQPAA